MTRRDAPEPAIETCRLGLTALTVLFGMQSLRTLMPLLVFVLQERFLWGTASVGLLAFAIFATGFSAAGVLRLLGPVRGLIVTAAGTGLLRLAGQLWQGDPVVDLGLAAAAVATWLLFVAVTLRFPAAGGGRSLATGWLAGLVLDTALHGAYGTYDMAWRDGGWTAVVLAALVGGQWALLAGLVRDPGFPPAASGVGWAWIGFGPFVFLELLLHGNVARLAALTGWPPELAASWIVIGRLAAIVAVHEVWRRGAGRRVTLVLALALAAATVSPWPSGPVAALALLASQVASAVLLACLASVPSGRTRLSVVHGAGGLALAVLFFLYYGALNLRLPFPRDALVAVAALAIGLAALAAPRRAGEPIHGARPVRVWLGVAALALLPLAAWLTLREPEVGGPGWLPLRLMTYNLHCGFGPSGDLDLEALARVIEEQEPEVVALQEASRGWVINGSVDAVTWLSRRLGMPFVFSGTVDPLWGNAILSRRPLEDPTAIDLPTEELLIARGLVAARVDLGASGGLRVIATHFHHPYRGGEIRELQSRAILDFWNGGERTAILGDLNATPEDPEMAMLRAAGFREVLELAGAGPGFTYPSWAPAGRIDYIWLSPDLTASEAAVPAAGASDHLPVVAVVEPRRAGESR